MELRAFIIGCERLKKTDELKARAVIVVVGRIERRPPPSDGDSGPVLRSQLHVALEGSQAEVGLVEELLVHQATRGAAVQHLRRSDPPRVVCNLKTRRIGHQFFNFFLIHSFFNYI